MVANLSSHKRGWDDRWEEFSDEAERGKAAYAELLTLVDEDTAAFNAIVAAWRSEPEVRDEAIQAATRQAIEVPLRVMEVALASMDLMRVMAEKGLAASASDAGVGALCARTAVLGAGLNVRINAKDLTDEEVRSTYLQRAAELTEAAVAAESEILALVESRLGS